MDRTTFIGEVNKTDLVNIYNVMVGDSVLFSSHIESEADQAILYYIKRNKKDVKVLITTLDFSSEAQTFG